jgi:hypothetical protein
MLEYTCGFNLVLSFPEILQANALLKKNLENAKAEALFGDLQFLRDQQTITQVT